MDENQRQLKKWHRWEVFFEFLVFGILVGIVEDLIAIALATDASITWRVILIVVIIAIPFAVIGEIFVDKIDFVKIFMDYFKRKNK